MSDNMAAENAGIIVSIGTVIGTVIAMLTFWTRLTDRIATAKEIAEEAKGAAGAALQEAAEAKNETRETREMIEGIMRDMHDRMERMGRETGESSAAIRQHITDLAFFVRDNFIHKDVFIAAMAKLDAGQLRTESKLDSLREQIRNGG